MKRDLLENLEENAKSCKNHELFTFAVFWLKSMSQMIFWTFRLCMYVCMFVVFRR